MFTKTSSPNISNSKSTTHRYKELPKEHKWIELKLDSKDSNILTKSNKQSKASELDQIARSLENLPHFPR